MSKNTGTHYIATFSNGATIERTSTRPFTHAWLAEGRDPKTGTRWRKSGFSTSATQAQNNMEHESKYKRERSLAEVVVVSGDAGVASTAS